MNLDLEIFQSIGIKAAYIVIVAAIAYIAYKIISKSINKFLRRKAVSEFVVTIIIKIIRFIIIVAALIVSLQVIGINVMSLWAITSAIIAAIAIGFVAFWSVISNSLCTILLLILRPFLIGDKIELFDLASPDKPISGVVININMIYTSIRESSARGVKGKNSISIIKVPNNFFFQKIIRVYSNKKTYSLDEQILSENSLLDKS